MRCRSLCVIVFVFALAALAQTQAPAQSVQVELLTSIKTKKAKVGDAVKAKTVTPMVIEHGTVIPVGSIVLGHVRAAQADSPDTHASFVTLAFDQVNAQHGKSLPLKLAVLAA